MNLSKLFEMQKALDDHIENQHPRLENENRFAKKLLASLVELAECANEQRGFKFWSKDQQPRLKHVRAPYMDLDDADFYNPLLEEYVDKLHFILSLGIENGFDTQPLEIDVRKQNTIEEQFLDLFYLTSIHYWFKGIKQYQLIISTFIGLGEMLGFTWEEVEQAYFTKNSINHERQYNGY
jgi:dimeric dUTPase (all-alpha-NTP-PPase superfamily)